MAQCSTTALAGAVPRPCVQGSRGRFGGFGPVPGVVSLPFPPSRPACPALRVAGRPVRVSLTLARWYAIPRGLCVPRARAGCPSGSPRVPFACVCARAPAASAPPSLGGVACAPRAVPALGTGRAVPRDPCPSACPAPVPCSVWRALGGAGPVPVPPYLAWGCGGGGRASLGGVPSTVARGVCGQALPLPGLPAHWAGRWCPLPTCCGRGRVGLGALHCPLGLRALWGLRAAGVVGGCPLTWLGAVRPPWGGSVAFVCRGAGWGAGGGAARAPCPRLCGRGGPAGRGVALPRSVPLPSLGRQQSGCHWRRSVHGGRGPPYHSGSWSPAFTGRDLCGVLARWCGLACSPRFLWEPAAGAGGLAALRLLSAASGGGGWGPRGLRAVGGDGWGGSRRGLPAPPLGGGPGFPTLAPLLSSAHSPSACACDRGRGAAPGWVGMRGDPCRPEPPLCPPWVGCGHGRVMGGVASILFWCAAARRPQAWSACCSSALVRARLSAASPAGAGGRGRSGARCPAASLPPRVTVPSGGGGASPRVRGGGGSILWPSSWGGGAGGGWGGHPSAPPPRRASACHLLSPACPPGVYSCRGGSGAAAGVGGGPVGRQWVSAAGGGGGTPPPLFAPPSSPGRPLKGPLCLRRPWRRRSAVGRQRAGRAGACLGPGAPSPRVQRPLQGGCGAIISSVCLRPLLSLRGRGGGVGGGLWSPGAAL